MKSSTLIINRNGKLIEHIYTPIEKLKMALKRLIKTSKEFDVNLSEFTDVVISKL